MVEIWIKYLILVVPVTFYMIFWIIKDLSAVRKYYKEYKKVEGKCMDIKYLVRQVKNEEGTYEVQYYSYIFNYNVDGVEYSVSREEEITDMYWINKKIKEGVMPDIWVNPNNLTDAFIPLFDDNTSRSIGGFIIIIGLFIACALAIQSSL